MGPLESAREFCLNVTDVICRNGLLLLLLFEDTPMMTY